MNKEGITAATSTKGAESPNTKYVVLDSNPLIADYWLRSPSFALLRDFMKKTSAKLVIPKIVFEEVVNHHKQDVDSLKRDLRNTLRDASRLLRDVEGEQASITAIVKASRK